MCHHGLFANMTSREGTACAFPASSSKTSETSDRKQQQERDQKGEDAERLRHRKAENETAELPFARRRVAQRAVQELAEQRADANAGGPRSDGGEAGADILGGDG